MSGAWLTTEIAATGAPSRSVTKKPSGSAAKKAAASSSPGFHPSAAAQSRTVPISSARATRIIDPALP